MTYKKLQRQNNEHNRMTIFRMEFRNAEQEDAYKAFRKSDLLVMLGVAGTGKTYLGVQFAVGEVIAGRADRIVICRPVVDAGEKLGFLPGTLEEKVHPYNLPIFDSIEKIVGKSGPQRELIEGALEIAPLAFMRGRTFDRSILLIDEAQNATEAQIKMFVTRIGAGSKIVMTGDPTQSDIPPRARYLDVFADLVEGVEGVAVVEFDSSGVVRHPIIPRLLARMG